MYWLETFEFELDKIIKMHKDINDGVNLNKPFKEIEIKENNPTFIDGNFCYELTGSFEILFFHLNLPERFPQRYRYYLTENGIAKAHDYTGISRIQWNRMSEEEKSKIYNEYLNDLREYIQIANNAVGILNIHLEINSKK